MNVEKKLIKSLAFISIIFFLGCDGVPIESIEECIIPNDTAFSIKNVISESQNDPNSSLDVSTDVPPRDCRIPTRAEGANLDIHANLKKFDTTQEAKMREALRRLKIIVNSEAFRERVISHTYNNEATYVQNNNLSNEEIYERIMRGAETLLPEDNQTMDLDIELYYSSKNVVGYTYPNVLQIWVNSKYFNTNSLGAVAANAIHEWLHKVGFGHDYNNTSRRPYSVPYAIGSIVKELVNEM